ncbi:MAG TPA: serine hydrolase domain-containing protein [Bacteroidia bacterium]|jgi:CubicO group peptidase (beta-lactamase class C family)|nr:serine hydrolase domain-containing protein [Bacteroidia bacterium]
MRVALFILILAVGWCFTSFTHSAKNGAAHGKAFVFKTSRAAETVVPPMRADLWEKYRVLDSVFTKESQLGYFNGCVAISYHDTLLYQRSFGTENISNKKQLCNESVFQLASVSKMFTGVAVMKLVEQNKISVKDPLDKYFPDFPYKNTTVEHLLTHKSGLPNYLYFYYQYAKTDTVPLTNRRVLELMQAHKPLPYFKPGRRFMYSNTNYVLLALLVEQVSGMPFQNFVKQEIFDKSGMTHTSFYHPLDTLSHQSFAFTYHKKQVGTDFFDEVFGDKGIYSTTGDMLAFSNALFSGKIISNLNLAIKPKVHTKYGQFYGYGFRINPNMGDTVVFHNGWWHGFRTAFHYRKNDKTTIVILSNRLDKSAYQTWKIFDILDKKQRIGTDILALKESE